VAGRASRRLASAPAGIAVALEPQLGALDPDSLLLALGAYRVAAHPSGAALAAAALPHVARHVPGLRPEGLLRAAQVYGRRRAAAKGFVTQPGGSGGAGDGARGDAAAAAAAGGAEAAAAAADELLASISAAAVRQLDAFAPAGEGAALAAEDTGDVGGGGGGGRAALPRRPCS
jgi:hypothetical protein